MQDEYFKEIIDVIEGWGAGKHVAIRNLQAENAQLRAQLAQFEADKSAEEAKQLEVVPDEKVGGTE